MLQASGCTVLFGAASGEGRCQRGATLEIKRIAGTWVSHLLTELTLQRNRRLRTTRSAHRFSIFPDPVPVLSCKFSSRLAVSLFEISLCRDVQPRLESSL